MAWTVILEDESKNAIKRLSDEFNIKGIHGLDQFNLLRYLDLYGDTIFNRLQMDALIGDLNNLSNIQNNPLINEIILLANHCKLVSHTYLTFYGD